MFKLKPKACDYADYYLSLQCEGKDPCHLGLDWLIVSKMCFKCDLCRSAVRDNHWEDISIDTLLYRHNNLLGFVAEQLEDPDFDPNNNQQRSV